MGIDTSINLDELNSFICQHDAVDFRTIDLLNSISLENFSWPSDDAQSGALLGQVKAYQRLLRVLPTDIQASDSFSASDLALNLLNLGIDSALKITQMGKSNFLTSTSNVFSNTPDLAAQVFKRALVSRNLVASKYIRQRQQLEPHARAAGVNL